MSEQSRRKLKRIRRENTGPDANTFSRIGDYVAIRDHISIDESGTVNAGMGHDPATQAQLEKEINDENRHTDI
nr:hypothetical protein 7 [Desulfobulbaceae bacterium]